MAKAFSYQLTLKELLYLLFGKKECPKCSGVMVKERRSEIVNGKIFNTMSVPLYIKGREEVKHYYHVFTCKNCGYVVKLDGFNGGK